MQASPYVVFGPFKLRLLLSLPPSLTPSRPSLTVEEGKALLHAAISSGILNDMGSGSRVDMCVIDWEGK
eukprot:5676406-Prymnesium_polylepis.1